MNLDTSPRIVSKRVIQILKSKYAKSFIDAIKRPSINDVIVVNRIGGKAN